MASIRVLVIISDSCLIFINYNLHHILIRNNQCVEIYKKKLLCPIFLETKNMFCLLSLSQLELKIIAVVCSLSSLRIDYSEVGAEWNLSPMRCYLFSTELLKHKEMELCVDLKRLANLYLHPKAT